MSIDNSDQLSENLYLLMLDHNPERLKDKLAELDRGTEEGLVLAKLLVAAIDDNNIAAASVIATSGKVDFSYRTLFGHSVMDEAAFSGNRAVIEMVDKAAGKDPKIAAKKPKANASKVRASSPKQG